VTFSERCLPQRVSSEHKDRITRLSARVGNHPLRAFLAETDTTRKELRTGVLAFWQSGHDLCKVCSSEETCWEQEIVTRDFKPLDGLLAFYSQGEILPSAVSLGSS
jgi:hypothetical protein